MSSTSTSTEFAPVYIQPLKTRLDFFSFFVTFIDIVAAGSVRIVLPMNIPNTLTILRVLFAIIVFVMIGLARYDLALLLFLLAAFTDALDGWWARHFKQITVFGRIMDPFADKFLICGVFICLVAIPELASDRTGYPSWLMLQQWMVVIIVGRELLVTSLRSFVESAGGDFSAKWLGKLKMVFQCVAVILALLYLSGGAEWSVPTYGGQEVLIQEFERLDVAAQKSTVLAQGLDYVCGTKRWRTVVFFTMLSAFWLTVGITLLSGLDYCIHATRMIRKQRERINEMKQHGQ